MPRDDAAPVMAKMAPILIGSFEAAGAVVGEAAGLAAVVGDAAAAAVVGLAAVVAVGAAAGAAQPPIMKDTSARTITRLGNNRILLFKDFLLTKLSLFIDQDINRRTRLLSAGVHHPLIKAAEFIR
jgi:hypothetical protein